MVEIQGTTVKIDNSEYQFTDVMPALMLNAYNKKSENSAPCQLCAEHPEQQGRRVHFHGSDVGSCFRSSYFKMTTGQSEEIAGIKDAFLSDGHLHEHAMLARISRDFDIVMPKNSAEKRVAIPMSTDAEFLRKFVDSQGELPIDSYRKFTLVCHFDGLIAESTEPNANVYLLECKSVKDYTWKQVKAGEIKLEWYGQMQSYMFATHIYRCYLLVKNRTTSEMMLPIRVDFNPEWFADRLKKLSIIYQAINVQKEVPRPIGKKATDSDCRFCLFKDGCYSKSELDIGI